ncbi:MAG TPA: Fur family transcriptional regulator [Patescibacteria group bacterium]|nr:Fur family transcriptional regulator [Patescibacteria group bacterium]
MTIEAYLHKIKQCRLKVTPKRKALLELFLKKERYLSPPEARTLLRPRFKQLGLPTVYRIMEELTDLGILIRIKRDSRRLYYTICRAPQHDHHHFICRKCKRVEEVEFCNFGDIAKFIEDRLQAKTESHFVQVEGLCCRCK